MILTENAGIDDKTNEDYKDMCDEIRSLDEWHDKAVMSWDKFVLHIGSFRFKAQWANWRNDKANLQWDMKNDLRRAVGLPKLPEPVQQVLEKHVNENATIYIGGIGPLDEIKEGSKWARYVQLSKIEPTVEDKSKKIRAKQKGFVRPSAVPNSINEWRKHMGWTWQEVINAGVKTLTDKADNP